MWSEKNVQPIFNRQYKVKWAVSGSLFKSVPWHGFPLTFLDWPRPKQSPHITYIHSNPLHSSVSLSPNAVNIKNSRRTLLFNTCTEGQTERKKHLSTTNHTRCHYCSCHIEIPKGAAECHVGLINTYLKMSSKAQDPCLYNSKDSFQI